MRTVWDWDNFSLCLNNEPKRMEPRGTERGCRRGSQCVRITEANAVTYRNMTPDLKLKQSLLASVQEA